MTNRNGWNEKIIAEFRANAGQVGGGFTGKDLLLLNTIGAKSGAPRTNPVAYVRDGDRLVVIASKAGAPTNPDWFYNVKANPEVTIEVGAETLTAHATAVTEEPERSALYAKMVAVMPGFADYERNTMRTIPVIVLTPKN